MTRGSERQASHLKAMLRRGLSLFTLAVCVIVSGQMSFAQRLPVGDGAFVVTSALVSEGRIYATSANQLYRQGDGGRMERIILDDSILSIRLWDVVDGVMLGAIVTRSDQRTTMATSTDGVRWDVAARLESNLYAVAAVLTERDVIVVSAAKTVHDATAMLAIHPRNGSGGSATALPFTSASGIGLHRKGMGVVIDAYLPDGALGAFKLTDEKPFIERLHPEARHVVLPIGDVGGDILAYGSGDTLVVDGMPGRDTLILPEGAFTARFNLAISGQTLMLGTLGRIYVSTDGTSWTRLVKQPAARFVEQGDQIVYANDSLILVSERSVGLWTYRRDVHRAALGPAGMQSMNGSVMIASQGRILLANTIVDSAFAIQLWDSAGSVPGTLRSMPTDAFIARIFDAGGTVFVNDLANGLRQVDLVADTLYRRGLGGRTVTSVAATPSVLLAAADGHLFWQPFESGGESWTEIALNGGGYPIDIDIRNDTAFVVLRVVDQEEGTQSYVLSLIDLRSQTEVVRHPLVRNADSSPFRWLVATDSTLVVSTGVVTLVSRNGGESWSGSVLETLTTRSPVRDGTGWCVPCRNETSIDVCVSGDAITWYRQVLDIPMTDGGIVVVPLSDCFIIGTVDGVYSVPRTVSSVRTERQDEEIAGPVTLTIVDIRGNIVRRDHVPHFSFGQITAVTSTLDTGLYICVIDNGVRRVVHKVVNYR